MKISRLDIRAFGHFTDLVLEFSAVEAGLHVVYGANEAGKSSALRALKAWLFGFPERTRDDFLHPRQQLLVGGELVEGEERLTCYRRKKRKGDLTDRDGRILDPGMLLPFLGGLDLELFESLYGIDHAALVRGGEEILDQRGEIGETLFSTGSGLGSLHRVLAEMEEKRDALFKPRASKPRINSGLSRHNKLRREIQALSLPPEEWQEHAERLDRITRELAAVNGQRLELDRRLRHLERLDRAAPLLARQREITRQQQTLGPHLALPDDFSARRNRVQQDKAAALRQLAQLGIRRERVTNRLQQFGPRDRLIERGAQIESLFQRLGAYSKALQDRPRLQGMRAVHLGEAERLLALVVPGLDRHQSESLSGLVQRKRKILGLSSRHTALLQAKKDVAVRQERAREQLHRTEKKLQSLERPTAADVLKQALARAGRLGNPDLRIQELTSSVGDLEQGIGVRLRRAGRWSGPPEELAGLELPSPGSVQRFRDRLQQLDHEEGRLQGERKQLELDRGGLETGKKELVYAGAIPSEKALEEIRQRRDHGWQLVCRNWLDDEDISDGAAGFSSATDLADTVTGLMDEADSVSDRLRFEADRVHAFARLRAEEEELVRRLAAIEEESHLWQEYLRGYNDEWHLLWHQLGIQPAPPDEMADWLVEMMELRQAAAELIRQRRELDALCRQRRESVAEIRGFLAPANDKQEELTPLLAEAEALVESLQAAGEAFRTGTREVESAGAEVVRTEKEAAAAAQELADWQLEWDGVAQLPGQDKSFAPDEAQDLLETMERIFSELKEADGLRRRMDGIDRDCEDFEGRVRELVVGIAADLDGEDAEETVLRLQERLTAAGKEQALRAQLEEEAEMLAAEIETEQSILAAAESEIKKLQALASCTDEKDLIKAEQNAADQKQLAEQLRQVEQDLRQVAGEMPLETLAAEVQATDVDRLPGETHALEQRIRTELDPAIQDLAEQKGEVKKLLEQMDGSRRAVEKAEEMESNLAVLRRDAEQYLRLQIGVDMLRREMERFRRQHQDPVLAIASELFARLTLDSFSGLKTDVDERGAPVLVGIRAASKESLEVGAMSTGSRDQLYLALRLAALRHRADEGRSMPFIVDDILINFDDARAAATLEVLADQGRTGQFILFTHHRQVADRAAAMKGVQVHQLVRQDLGTPSSSAGSAASSSSSTVLP